MIKFNTRRLNCLLISWIILSLPACAVLKTTGELVVGVGSYFFGGENNITPPTELADYKEEIEIDWLWKEQVGDGADDQLVNLVLAISDDKILAADRNGLVQAREIKTGDLIWETETDYDISAGLGIGDKTAIFATSNAEVVALNIATGEQIWSSIVSSEVLACPVIADNKVIIRTTDGKLVALNEKDGTELWVFEKNVPVLSIRGIGTPLILGDNIIAGYANGKLLALRLRDGKHIWETSIVMSSGKSEVERLVDLDVDPIEVDRVIYISSYQGGTSAVLELDGDILWRREDISSYSGLSYDLQYLYVSDTKSAIWQLDQHNNTSLWKQDALTHRMLTAPAVYKDYVVIGDYDGYLHWLAKSDGRQLGRIQIAGSAIKEKPIIIGDTVFIYAKDGTLAALKARAF